MRIRKRYVILIVLFAILFTIAFGIRTFLTSWSLSTFAMYPTLMINMALMSPVTNSKKWLGASVAKYCKPEQTKGWYKQYYMHQCVIVATITDYKPCGFWTYAITCAVVVMPSIYFKDKRLLKELQEAVNNPCLTFENLRSNNVKLDENRLSILNKLYKCDNKSGGRKYSMYILLLKDDIDHLNTSSNNRLAIRAKRFDKVIYISKWTGKMESYPWNN